MPCWPAEPSIPFLLLYGVCQHIEGVGVAELLDHLGHRVSVQPVVPVMFRKGRLDGLLAGDVDVYKSQFLHSTIPEKGFVT